MNRVNHATFFRRVSTSKFNERVYFTKRSMSTKMFKPFKPPLLKKVDKPARIESNTSDLEFESRSPPTKRRRLLVHHVPDSPPKQIPTSTTSVNAQRKPLLVVNKSLKSHSPPPVVSGDSDGYYIVLWYGLFFA